MPKERRRPEHVQKHHQKKIANRKRRNRGKER